MSGRVARFLVLLVIACELSLHTVECQCTTKHCFNDDNDVDVIKRFSYIQKEMGSLKEEVDSLKEEKGSLKEEVVSLKDEMGSLKEEVVSLKEQLSTTNTADVYIAPMPDISGFYQHTYNCKEWLDKGNTQSGWYLINEHSRSSGIHWVYCDMVTDGGGWLVFQRRHDGSVNFARDWRAYEDGFGGISSEFWLGNKALHTITSNKNYALRIDMEAFDADAKYAVYSSFKVESGADNYRMTFGSYTAGNLSTAAADKFTQHSGNLFTTLDVDNERSGGNCARSYMGGWWYDSCFSVNLNGEFFLGFKWHNYASWLKKSEMKLRPM